MEAKQAFGKGGLFSVSCRGGSAITHAALRAFKKLESRGIVCYVQSTAKDSASSLQQRITVRSLC